MSTILLFSECSCKIPFPVSRIPFFHVLLKCTSQQILLSSQSCAVTSSKTYSLLPPTPHPPKTCASAVLTFLPTSSEWSQVICGHFCLVSFMSHTGFRFIHVYLSLFLCFLRLLAIWFRTVLNTSLLPQLL